MPNRSRGSDGRFTSEPDADFVGPLRLVVAGTLLYGAWLAFKASSPFPSDTYPAVGAAHTPKGS